MTGPCGPSARSSVSSFCLVIPWALVHHLFGGLRHFVWDLGYGYEKHFATKLAIANLIGSVAVTALIWIVGYVVR